MATPSIGFHAALEAAADLDAFVDENVESEYTRGIVEVLIYGLMIPDEDEDMGNDHNRHYVTQLGRELTREY